MFADHLTEAQKRAYIIADNRMAMDAGWDEELLRVEIESLQGRPLTSLSPVLTKRNSPTCLMTAMDQHEDDFDVDEELKKPCIQNG